MADFFDFTLHPVHIAIAAFGLLIVLYLAGKAYLKNKHATAVARRSAKSQPTASLGAVKTGAQALATEILSAATTDDSVEIGTALAGVGAYAGYICQASIRKEMIEGRGMAENSAFAVFTAANGQTYFFGDLLNKVLAEAELSIWGLASDAVQQLGAEVTVDVAEIFKHVTATIGTDQFGSPRIPAGQYIGESPLLSYAQQWQIWQPLLDQYCTSPTQWALLMGYAIHEMILLSDGLIDPNDALRIVMECAIPMSKVDLTSSPRV